MKINLTIIILAIVVACNAQSKEKQATVVKSEEITKNLADGKSVQIKNAVIEGSLIFDKASTVNANVYFEKCIFKGSIKAEDVRFNGNVIFLESEFQEKVEFHNNSIFGMVNFSRSVFKSDAIFANMAVWAKNSYFSGIKASKKFSLEASDFHGNLTLIRSEFSDAFSLQETFVLGSLQAADIKFDGSTDFAMLEVLRRAIFTHSTFKNTPDFSSSKIVKE